MLLEFAAKAKKRKCKAGYPCGRSCISRNYFCKKPLTGQGKSWADWLRKNGRIREKPRKEKVSKKTSILDRPLTREERSQPDKLIEVGKAFAAKYNLEGSLKTWDNYQKDKKQFIEAEKRRTDKVNEERQKVLKKLNEIDKKLWQVGDSPEYDSLIKERDKLEKQLEPLNKEVVRKRYDRLDEIAKQILEIPSDNWLLRTTKSKEEYKQKKAQTKRDRKRLFAEKQAEEEKLPGTRDFNQALKGLVERSGLDNDTAQNLITKNFRFKTKAGNDGLYKYSKLGTKSEIAELKSDLSDVVQLTGQAKGKVNIFKQFRKSRAWAKPFFMTENQYDLSDINIGDSYSKKSGFSAKETTYHEFSHTLEYQHQEFAIANQQWLKNRATGNIQSLKSLVPNSRYEAYERAYPDNFIDPYVGKKYDDERRGYISTEVLTMGVQHFVSGSQMQKLFKADKEHFYLTLGNIIEIQNKNKNNAN